MKRFQIALLLSSVLLAHIVSGQQPAPAGVEGTVVKLNSNDPLSKVRIGLLTSGGAPTGIVTTTDDTGKFIFPSVRPGQYRLFASRQAYIRTEYGERVTGGPGTIFTLTSGQRMRDARIQMTPGGVISGRVLDRGKPVGIGEAPLVFAAKVSYELGQRVLTNVLSARTNDLGEYHIFWLPPGRYYVAANINDAPGNQGATAPTITSVGYANPNNFIQGGGRFVLIKAIGNRSSDTEMHVPMFYPGVPDFRNARVIDVGPGAEVRGVDIQADPVPALHIRGYISGIPPTPPGEQPLRIPIALYPLDPSMPTAVTFNGPVININPDENGFFDKDMVSPGSYMLYAAAGDRRARVPIEVRDRDVNGVNIVLARGITLSGRVVVDGSNGNTPISPTVFRIALATDPIVGGFRSAPIASAFSQVVTPSPDGGFTINTPLNNNNSTALLPGNYRVFAIPILSPAMGWSDPPGIPNLNPLGQVIPPALENTYIKSIRFGERDVLKDGLALVDQTRETLVITIGTNAGSLEGRVLNADKKPVGAATAVLIPENDLRFRINHKYAPTDSDGRFQLKGIAPGDYKLFVWEQAERGSWQDPEFVSNYESKGMLVHIDEGGKVPVEVTSITP